METTVFYSPRKTGILAELLEKVAAKMEESRIFIKPELLRCNKARKEWLALAQILRDTAATRADYRRVGMYYKPL
jgi:hypothetical protein